jgi:molecular chaperone GrpE
MKKDEEREDVDFEPEDEMGSLGAVKAKMQKLKDELEKVKKERQEYLDGWQRAKADAINMRKESDLSAKRTGELLREALVHDIIPALDSFDMATQSEAWGAVADGWRAGMEMVRDQLIGALKGHGVERYGKAGDRYDHNIHDAVQETDEMPGKAGEIVRLLRAGYKSGDRVLRPAQVIVKK